MRDKRYYTPNIEEFHVGFEYEMNNGHEWTAQVFPNPWWNDGAMGGINSLSKAIISDIIRVKHLDHEDIVSEGWGNCVVTMLDDTEKFGWCKMHYMLIEYDEQYIVYENATENKSVASSNIVFNGTIRNRSELRLIMKMLGISNEAKI